VLLGVLVLVQGLMLLAVVRSVAVEVTGTDWQRNVVVIDREEAAVVGVLLGMEKQQHVVVGAVAAAVEGLMGRDSGMQAVQMWEELLGMESGFDPEKEFWGMEKGPLYVVAVAELELGGKPAWRLGTWAVKS